MANPKRQVSERNLNEMIELRRGRVLRKIDPSQGRSQRLELRCSNSHVWETTLASILRGSWCPSCAAQGRASRRKLSISELRIFAAKRGGSMLSKTYVNALQKLEWQCAAGHTWQASPNNIRAGSWCPYCRKRSVDLFKLAKAIKSLTEEERRSLSALLKDM